MRNIRSDWRLLLPLAGCLLTLVACQSTGSRFLRLIGVQKDPLAIALVMRGDPDDTLKLLNPFAPYQPLQKSMSESLARPVSVDVCFAFQVESGLQTGWYDLAVVTPAQYAYLAGERNQAPRVIAAPLDVQGRVARPAVLIVPTNSELQRPDQLKGTSVMFGRVNDARTHLGALAFLREHGVKKTDLSLDMLPVPGSLKHRPNSRAVAQAVMNYSAEAGFIDHAAWMAFPESDDREEEPARDKFRVIGQTADYPSRLIIAGSKLDNETFKEVQAFLLAVGDVQPEVLEPLEASGYAVPGEHVVYDCRALNPVPMADPAEPTAPTDADHESDAGDEDPKGNNRE